MDRELDIEVELLYANKTEIDILMRDDLDMWADDDSVNFKTHYLLSQVCSSIISYL